MEFTAAAALFLLVLSEILPYTPLKGNGVVQEIIEVLRAIFPRESEENE
jgi:hypothetical protein